MHLRVILVTRSRNRSARSHCTHTHTHTHTHRPGVCTIVLLSLVPGILLRFRDEKFPKRASRLNHVCLPDRL